MKISNFLFNYLSLPLLPRTKWTKKFLFYVLKFSIFHFLFYRYLIVCLNKREYKKILFYTESFIFNINLPLPIFDVYLQSLRNLGLYIESIDSAKKPLIYSASLILVIGI